MNDAWQMIIVGALVLWAVANLALRLHRLFISQSANACGGGCRGCPSHDRDQGGTLVQLGVPPQK